MRIQSIDFENARRREWLETNGLGGFASSTISGMNTRRYHGLLMAALKPPVGRTLLLSKLEEIVHAGGRSYELGVNQYPGAIHPTGYDYLAGFRLDPFPTWIYRIAEGELEKQLFLVHGENTVVVEYRWRGAADAELEVRPLIAFRDFHALTRRNSALNGDVRAGGPGMLSVRPYADHGPLYFGHSASAIAIIGDWYHDFEYEVERERGLDCREDLFNPFLLRFPLDRPATIIASTKERSHVDAPRLHAAELRRREEIAASAPVPDDPLVRQLTIAADQFIVDRGELKTVIAGYPWFGDWGRDTMIALPGLTLATGRFDIARDILRAFAASADMGMLPNRFPDGGEAPEFNSVDATLWFFEAVRAYLRYTGDFEFVRGILPSLGEILEWFLRGTRYGIRMDPEDCLLRCGEPGVQLTWMDAKIGDWVVTPRTGKPVEVQALWYNALRIAEELYRKADDAAQADRFRGIAVRAKNSFLPLFWNPARACLYDVVAGGEPDAALRPNQIFAASLHHPLIEGETARQVVAAVERELLTPAGLRSLSIGDAAYRGRYEGGVWERDSAYHQGTVWPWLMGPFLSAYVRTHSAPDSARAWASAWLASFADQLNAACLGQVSEIADGDAPHRARGCAAQAWSVGELLRAAVEDVHR
ncbi:MAG: amylo-alpha-1,6-glucosidase [Bryobacteraceae bacterium]